MKEKEIQIEKKEIHILYPEIISRNPNRKERNPYIISNILKRKKSRLKRKKSKCLSVVGSRAVAVSGNELNEPGLNGSHNQRRTLDPATGFGSTIAHQNTQYKHTKHKIQNTEIPK